MFDLGRLRLLRELAHRGTRTAVGAALGHTSSAVSQQLAILECEARAKLLERVGRRVRLTAEGERLAAHADAILQAVVAAEQDLKGAKEKPKGVLEVCCFPTFAKARLLLAITRARARYPELRVIIHELNPPMPSPRCATDAATWRSPSPTAWYRSPKYPASSPHR